MVELIQGLGLHPLVVMLFLTIMYLILGSVFDTIAAMVPRNLQIDRAEFQREHLNVTSGSVGTEIIVERALQSLMIEVSVRDGGRRALGVEHHKEFVVRTGH